MRRNWLRMANNLLLRRQQESSVFKSMDKACPWQRLFSTNSFRDMCCQARDTWHNSLGSFLNEDENLLGHRVLFVYSTFYTTNWFPGDGRLFHSETAALKCLLLKYVFELSSSV